MTDRDCALLMIKHHITAACKEMFLDRPVNTHTLMQLRDLVTKLLCEYSTVMSGKINVTVKADGDSIFYGPGNLYTAIALLFPEYLLCCCALPEQGSVELPNGVCISYYHDKGAWYESKEPSEVIRLNFTVRGADES